jgi:hypothetical protein
LFECSHEGKKLLISLFYLFLNLLKPTCLAIIKNKLTDIGAWSEALQLQTPTKPCQRFGHSAVSFGSLLYIYGGQSFKAVEQHENHQQGQQMLNEGTTEHGQPLVDEPMISITIHDDVYCFDTETLMWVEVDTETLDVGGNQVDRSLLKRHSHIALPLPSGNMLVFGGASEYNKVLNDIWELNLKTKSWVQINALSDAGSFPPAREMHSACYHNIVGSRSSCCKIYIMGGRSADGTVLGDFWLLALQGNFFLFVFIYSSNMSLICSIFILLAAPLR